MRSKAGKLWTSLTLALLLALSALFAPLTAEVENQAEAAPVAQHETADGHSHSGPGPCHKAAACEVPVALQPWQQVSITEKAGKLAVVLNDSGLASVAPEAHLPPPKT
ncbi:hypothetical protein K3725_21725 (plasmid) [Leisingera sp. S132]|uniref:hypothetical protein n=1 Tax=Leisingera sp. S132 TaxID=2867016 RepID=UPI001798B6A5|nr:hypothetical protein [Leisingera sp. S132]NVK14048.1 hypothetical protein [Paracoccaceae bacterium]UWQ81712.1 hypothetical protein K3725_21725 [Leisingera sp. S132]